MKKLLLLFFIFSIGTASKAQTNPDERRLIVQFKADRVPQNAETAFQSSELATISQTIGLTRSKVIGNRQLNNTYLLKYDNTQLGRTQVMELLSDTDLFLFVEPDHKMSGTGVAATTPNDPLFYNRQWGLFNDGTFPLSPSTSDADIDMDEAWDLSTGDPDLIMAVMDSGLRYNHPELADRVWQNPNETSDGTDSDNNGYVDDLIGYDFAYEDNDPVDDHGHGTNVTSIMGMTGNNGLGYAGVNWNSQIMICKVLDEDNSGFYSWMIDGIFYVVDNGADVINMSIGGNSPSSALEQAIDYCYANNVPIAVSTGNQNSVIQYPARYANSIAVGSTDPDDGRTAPFFWDSNSGSNFGPQIDLVAPGNYIYGLSHTSNTNYNTYWGGTSQASPHVAGVISLMLSIRPELTVDQINLILQATSEDQVGDSGDTPGFDNFYGHGRLNARDALEMASTLGLEDNQQPTIRIGPNPMKIGDRLTINGLPHRDYGFRLFNTLGSEINLQIPAWSGQKAFVEMNGISTGFYLMQIIDQRSGSKLIRKLIIQ
ncbi:S8 family peptidase [Aureitalea marina]|uniref:Peptidase S8/S53 domain-containing protein n=1 Tax=Aureitalea marina TaxID=930804 RepID=A0A2S7KMS9_9FLAO|nr:S8 family peptidase [Aureitalea marina]PQB03911.1 hypothetical protein BST85_02555 [Aureitalea marina]